MDFTFGIITAGNNNLMINKIINSIERQNIPNYEIIIVGGENINRKNVYQISFDERIKDMWITKKKNIITNESRYENIVYLHDYVEFCDGWYEGFLKFGNNFKVCMNKIENYDGTRFRDWSLWAYDAEPILKSRGFLIPYDMTHLSKIMYISGTYWVAKKSVMMDIKLDERLIWGQGEDVEWSYRIRNKYNFSMNEYSSVKLMKLKDKAFDYSSIEDINILKNIK